MLSITVHYKSEEAQFVVAFDSSNSGFEVLYYQIFSLIDVDIFLVDYAGRLISTIDELIDIAGEDVISIPDVPDGLVRKASLWACDKSTSVYSVCSQQIFDEGETIIQPLYAVTDTTMALCMACVKDFDSSVVSPCMGKMSPFTCACKTASEFGFSFLPYVEKDNLSLALPLKLYFKREYLNYTISSQSPVSSVDDDSFRGRLLSGCETVKVYEDPGQQLAARGVIDNATIAAYADEYRHKCNSDAIVPLPADDVCFMKGLLRWFKRDFFKWCNAPPCDSCKSMGKDVPQKKGMQFEGMAPPTEYERNACWAHRVELHRCKACNHVTRFPRINNPSFLLTTSRKGRCGEWANAFCLICRTLGIDALYCMDWTDHVWVEVWIPSLKRYVHTDSCEMALDTPLVYEFGWNKKLTHIVSFSRHSVIDTTARYTRAMNDVLMRRESEYYVRDQIRHYDQLCYNNYLIKMQSVPSSIETNMWGGIKLSDAVWDISPQELLMRRRRHQRELEGQMFSTEKQWKPEELIGRISGDLVWKRMRGEDGDSGSKCSREDSCALETATPSNGLTDTANFSREIHIPYSNDDKYNAWGTPGLLTTTPHASSHVGFLDVAYKPSAVSISSTGTAQRENKWFTENNSSIADSIMNLYVTNSNADMHANGACNLNCNGRPIIPSSDSQKQSRYISGVLIDPVACGAVLRAETCCNVSESSISIFDDTYGGFSSKYLEINTVAPFEIDGGMSTVTFPDVEFVRARFSIACQSPTVGCSKDVYEFVTAIDYICCLPFDIVIIPESSAQEFRASGAADPAFLEKYLQMPTVLGCSIDPDYNYLMVYGNSPGVSLSGCSLKPCKGAKTFVKRKKNTTPDVETIVGSVDEPSVDISVVAAPIAPLTIEKPQADAILYYIPLSSRQAYPDTSYFDTTHFLNAITDCQLANFQDTEGIGFRQLWGSVKMTEITAHSGPYMNGISCSYAVGMSNSNTSPPVSSAAPHCRSADLSGSQDNPHLSTIKVDVSDPIENVTVMSGGWVDSITITTRLGVCHKFGGSGGSYQHSFTIPAGYELLGFYGGFGGHLHNFGVIIRKYDCNVYRFYLAINDSRRLTLYNNLVHLVDRHSLWSCGLLNFAQGNGRGSLQPDIGTLIALLLHLFENNTAEVIRNFLGAFSAYMKNLIKRPQHKEPKEIKLSNSYLQKNVMIARGGLALFTFGPSRFQIDYESDGRKCLLRCPHQLPIPSNIPFSGDGEENNISIHQWVEWMRIFSNFLQDVCEVDFATL